MRKYLLWLGIVVVMVLQFWQVRTMRSYAREDVSDTIADLREDLQESGMAPNQIRAITRSVEQSSRAGINKWAYLCMNLQIPVWGVIGVLGYTILHQKERLDQLTKDE